MDAHVVIGGMAHDFDFARLELLKLLAERPNIRSSVSADFENHAALERARFLLTYTCNVEPSPRADAALADFVARGGRWFALHATNALLDWGKEGVAARKAAPLMMKTLGSRFQAHPPIGPFMVRNLKPDHPLVAGIADFETEDELYLGEEEDRLDTLLGARFVGEAPGFVQSHWPEDRVRPVMYLRKVGEGAVLYLNLGHCRGHYDAPHRAAYFPEVQRCSWRLPQFYDLLRRGLAWAAGDLVSD
ncbi:MAG: ThuA domain-containing protein [Alphaproteobacteria bacterium]|nr:ThuA domain-containing protein [Alphaproteobacteria bacterium]